ncbi:hypothetical protein NDU88_001751 [Pleurodeles waltl]|uniref:Uncharacterized protein n=1 Tax=Pleurodeles waltl TaxID=8319 RepID=A0AAV7LE20_PLEWA|nr:hypothetical protein NDU88_001751 [Pleurodeles waltl]
MLFTTCVWPGSPPQSQQRHMRHKALGHCAPVAPVRAQPYCKQEAPRLARIFFFGLLGLGSSYASQDTTALPAPSGKAPKWPTHLRTQEEYEYPPAASWSCHNPLSPLATLRERTAILRSQLQNGHSTVKGTEIPFPWQQSGLWPPQRPNRLQDGLAVYREPLQYICWQMLRGFGEGSTEA